MSETASEKSHPKPKEDSEPAASEANVNAPHTKASGDSGAVSEEFALEAQSKNLTENGSGVHGCQNENSSSSGQYVADPYGLSSMLKIVRMNDLNINVMVGTDIKSLGFDLNERETLSSDLISPLLDEQPPKEDFEFTLPSYYYSNPPALKMVQLQSFASETLFYIFYTIVKSALQGYAAAELYNRGWVYHNAFRKWFTTVAAQRQTGSIDLRDPTSKKNEWVYFEPAVWEKRYHSGDVDTSQFMKPNDLRELLNNFIQHLCPPGGTWTESGGGDSYVGVAPGLNGVKDCGFSNVNTDGLTDAGAQPAAYGRAFSPPGMVANNGMVGNHEMVGNKGMVGSNGMVQPPPPPGFGNLVLDPRDGLSHAALQSAVFQGTMPLSFSDRQLAMLQQQHLHNLNALGSVGSIRYS